MTKTQVVTQRLRDEVLSGRYQAGDRMPSERELVERLGIHRGAIREGLRAVEQLGLIEINTGGPRVRPLQDASLDIVGSLLALEDPPNPHLVGQLLEMHAGLFAMAVRLSVERADETAISKARSLLSQIKKTRSEEAYGEVVRGLVHLSVESCGNLVLKLVRNGLKVHFWSRLMDLGISVRPTQKLLTAFVRDLDQALQDRNAAVAAELVLQLMSAQKVAALKQLERIRRDQAETGDPVPVGKQQIN